MSASDRLHSLDATRALALILGVVLHATMSFVPDARETGWPFPDASPSRSLDAALFVIHSFRMTLFFCIAGFFARLSLHRKGWRAFTRDRAKRIALPLVVGWIILVPLVVAVISWSSTQPGAQRFSVPLESPERGVPLMHLWFLYLLLLFYAVGLPARAFVITLLDRAGRMRVAIDGVVRAALRYPVVAPIVLAAPLALCLYHTAWWFMKVGIPTPAYGLIPNAPATIGYGIAFGFGWWLHRQPPLLRLLQQQCLIHLSIAVALTTTAWVMVAPLPRFVIAPTSDEFRAIYATCYAAAGWAWTLGIMGAAVRYMSHHRAIVRYLADASYWMYLVHLPLVWVLQVWVMNWRLHWSIKFPLILVIAFTLLLASYHWIVRLTFIGAVLNGTRRGPHGTTTRRGMHSDRA